MKEFMTKLYNYDHKQSDYAENSSEEDEIHVELGTLVKKKMRSMWSLVKF